LPLSLRIVSEPQMLLLAFFGLIAIAGFSAWWPAWRASRLKIVDALRHA
jgi:putative ABC transport system permease protein